MALFAQVGNHWLNLDLVTVIQFVEAPHKPDELRLARVHFNTGKHQDFKKAEEIEALAEFLKSHKAP